MLKLSKLAAVLAAGLFAMMWAMPAQAQATRTWISGVGDDANPCSRTAPCKTFAGAISKTATGGEIDCLDPGGFGAVTVTKSITLDCGGGIGGQAGSILNSGTNGITVSCAGLPTAACIVKVRNLTIDGIQASGSPGLSGIKVLNNCAALIVEHVGIFGQGGVTGTNGGIDFEPNIGARLYTLDVEIQYGLGDGILLKPQTGGFVLADLNRTSSFYNAGSGLRADTSVVPTGGSGINGTITDSTFAGNTQFGVFAVTTGTTPAQLMLGTVTASNNTSAGINSNGSGSTIRMGSSVVSGNGTGLVAPNSGSLLTYGNNQVAGNLAGGDGSTTGTVSPK